MKKLLITLLTLSSLSVHAFIPLSPAVKSSSQGYVCMKAELNSPCNWIGAR